MSVKNTELCVLVILKKKGRDWMWLGGDGGVDDVLHCCFMSRQWVSRLWLKERSRERERAYSN